jgi:voltage-gated potassium channel
MIVGTSPTVGKSGHQFLAGVVTVVWVFIAAQFISGLWKAPASGRSAYLVSAEGLIDLTTVLALPLGWLLTSASSDAQLFALIWVLRYIRHTTGLALFWRIMKRSRAPLLSIASLFVAVFLTAATLAYVFERNAQPETFGSVPSTMWWAIATLTTTGYGDLAPTSIWGRLLGGWVMIGGIVMFALQAGIIATAFAEELQRRHFLHTWNLVTAVPFFRGLGAAAIADVVRLLSAREVSEGSNIVSVGQPGDAMYFIVSGEVTVQLTPEPLTLGPGNFFGEMALLFGAPRSATVTATEPTVLLVLDIADFRELAGRRPEVVNLIEAEGKRRREANAQTTHS